VKKVEKIKILISRSVPPETIKKILKSQSGFSLIEILVALFLMASVFGIISIGDSGHRKNLEEAANDLERAIRFSTDESALRNTIVRLHLLLDESPQEYAVEYGPNDNFVLPTPIIAPASGLSEREQEELAEETKKLNRNFNKIREFQEKNKSIHETVRIVGVGTEQNEFLQTDFHSSLYIYPTGEKDSGIIILATDEEVVSLTINAFTMDFEREYQPLDYEENDEIEDVQNAIAEEIFQKWLAQ